MDYTVSLQVQHQLTVFPTHFYQGYSVELQVHAFLPPHFPHSSRLLFPPLLLFCSVHAGRRACLQRSECDFMEMLCCRGKAWLSCCMLIFFFIFPLTDILVACRCRCLRDPERWRTARCGTRVAAKVKRSEAGGGLTPAAQTETGRVCVCVCVGGRESRCTAGRFSLSK